MLSSGDSIGHYRILSELGHGGMGIVFKAEDLKLKRTVAIKVLPSAMLSSESDRARFYREARAAAALSHPNIATVFAIDEAAPEGTNAEVRPFIAMEFIDGPSLADRIAEGPLPMHQVVSIALQLASALQAAHEHEIVHRDIKSANVMLTAKGDVRVLDFGLAKTLQSTKLTQLGSTLGTVAYMSPEQARGEEVDLRSDLWSMGVVLYEMIAGRLPFPGEYEQAVIFSILNQDPQPLTSLRTGVTVDVERIVDKLLAKDRSLRYQGAADVITDLKRLEIDPRNVSVGPLPVSTATRIESVVSPSKPRVGLLLPVATATFVIGLLAARFVWYSPREAEPQLPTYLDLAFADSIVLDDPVWSPDGRRILFSETDGKRAGVIVEYDLTTGKLTEVTGAEFNIYPKYAPDGRSILFIQAGRRLLSKAIGSPEAILVARAYPSNAVAFISPDEIVFGRFGYSLVRNVTTGKEDTLSSELSRGWFEGAFVSADSTILFIGGPSDIFAIDIESRQLIDDLAIAGARPLGITSSDDILFGTERTSSVLARHFNRRTRKYTDTGMALFQVEGRRFAVSTTGNLIYQPKVNPESAIYAEPIYEYTNGQRGGFVSHARTYTKGSHHDFRISPDGRVIAVKTSDGLLRFERSSNIAVRLVGPEANAYPGQFSNDGRWLYFDADSSTGPWRIYRVDSQGRGKPELLVQGDTDNGNPSILSDGNTLYFDRTDPQTGSDIWTLDLTTHKETPIVTAEGDQERPRVSPDGRFVAFRSYDDRGNEAVLVKDLLGGTVTTAATGMAEPRWSLDGSSLFYQLNSLEAVYRVRWDSNTGTVVSEPETMLFEPRAAHIHWDVTPDAATILASWPGEDLVGGSRWKVALNWAETLDHGSSN